MHQLLFAVLVRLVVLYELTDFYGSLFFTAAILLLSAFMFNQDNLNQRFVVNPNLRFLAERDRCVAYVLRPFYAEPENLTILLPHEVILLLLFDGKTGVIKTLENYALIFNKKYTSILDLVAEVNDVIHSISGRLQINDVLVLASLFSDDILSVILNRHRIEDFFISDKDIKFDFANLRLSKPLTINFNVTTVCSFKCKYCYHPLEPITSYISIKRLNYIFREAKSIGLESVLLSGGDPMLRNDIDKIIESLALNGLHYTISTKSILTDIQIQRYANEYGMKSIQISFDTIDPQIAKLHLGIDDDLYVQKTITMIKKLIAHGVHVRIKSVVTRLNIGTIPKSVLFFKDLGVDGVNLTQYGRSYYRHVDDLFPTKEQLLDLRDSLIELKKKYPCFDLGFGDLEMKYREPVIANGIIHGENIFSKRGVCNAGRFSITLLPNGKVTICENLPYRDDFILGDLTKQSIMEYWNSTRVMEWLSPPDRNLFDDSVPCKTCDENNYKRCHRTFSRCFRYCLETFGTVNSGDPNCPLVKFEPYRIN